MRLARYILVKFLLNLFKVQLGFLLLVLVIDGVEQAQFLARYDVPGADTLRLIALRTPQFLMMIFPLVLMLASLSTFVGLSRSSELVVIRASGQSALRLLVIPVGATLIIGALLTAVFNPIVAATIQRSDALLAKYNIGGQSLVSLGSNGIWLRQGSKDAQFVIQADRTSFNGSILYNLNLFEFTLDGVLTRRISAQSARLADGLWLMRNGTEWRFDYTSGGSPLSTDTFTTRTQETTLTSQEILEKFASPEAVSIWELPQLINRLNEAGFSSQRQRLFLQSELARPILLVAMVLIGAGFSMRHARFGQTGIMVLIAVFSAFLLYALKSVAESLGAAYEIPIELAAWGPPMAGILLTMGLLLHLEDG
ncbi:MAG: LPS export ABC transporter permease LptG [Rhodobacteraceae bacterium]|nr:LPS export ABC transporter permease LptG [Paracoccaceae bacterium]